MIDREIRDALNVDPSPEFLARVRTRVAKEPAPSAWRWSWTLATAGTLAAALVLAVVVSRPPAAVVAQPFKVGNGDDAGLKPSATNNLKPPATDDQQPAPPTATPSEVAQAFRPAVAALESRATSHQEAPRQPEVLVNAAEMHALQGLIAAAGNSSITLTPLTVAAPSAAMELEPVTDIVIAPITIDPIAPESGAEGERP